MRTLGALVLAGLLAAGCTSEPPAPAPAATPSTGWPVELEAEALGLAPTPQGLIVVTSGTSRHPPQVHRFDADGRQAARQAAVGNPNGLAVAPDGTAWVPATRHPDMRSGTGVPVLDPVSLQPRREIDAGGEPLSVAFLDRTAWIGLHDKVQVVDTATGRAVRIVPIAGTAYQIVPAGGVVDVVLDDVLVSLDARTGRQLTRRAVDSAGSLTAVLAGGALWVAWLDEGRTRLGRFDPRTLAPAGVGPVYGGRGVALAAAGDRLWVADHTAGTLSCLDPATGAVRSTVKVANTSSVAADGEWAYVADAGVVRRVPATC